MTKEKLPIKKPRDEELLEAREEEYRKLRKIQAVCTFTVYGPVVSFINEKLKDPTFIRDVCGLRSESQLLNAVIFIFKVITDALGPRLGAYLPPLVEAVRKGDEERARKLVETMIADAFSRPLQCPEEAVKLYEHFRLCIGDAVDRILQETSSPEDTCMEIVHLIQIEKEWPGIAKMLRELLREVKEIRRKLEEYSGK